MNVMTSLPQFPWMSLLIMLPLGGAVLCLLHGKRPADCRGLALATSLATFGVALYLFVCHGQGSGRWKYQISRAGQLRSLEPAPGSPRLRPSDASASP